MTCENSQGLIHKESYIYLSMFSQQVNTSQQVRNRLAAMRDLQFSFPSFGIFVCSGLIWYVK